MLTLTWVLEFDAQRTCAFIRNRYNLNPRTRDKEEKRFGPIIKEIFARSIPIGSMAVLRTFKDKTGKFGRILGELVWKDPNY